MVNNFIKSSVTILVTSVVFIGCGTPSVPCQDTIPSSISKLGCDKALIIGKTTRSEIEESFGGTIFEYKKPNDVVKVAYKYVEHVSHASQAFAGRKPLRINLELWYDKNNILIKKKYNNDPSYHHPEMTQDYNSMMNNLPVQKGGYGSMTTPLGAMNNMFK